MIKINYILIRKKDSKPYYGIDFINDNPENEDEPLYSWIVVDKNTLKVSYLFTKEENEKFYEIFNVIDETCDKLGYSISKELERISTADINKLTLVNEESANTDDVIYNEINMYSPEVENKRYISFVRKLNKLKERDLGKLVKIPRMNTIEFIIISGYSIDYSIEHLPQVCIVGNSVKIESDFSEKGNSYIFSIGNEYSYVDIDYIEEVMYNFKHGFDYLKYEKTDYNDILVSASDTYTLILKDIKEKMSLKEEKAE